MKEMFWNNRKRRSCSPPKKTYASAFHRPLIPSFQLFVALYKPRLPFLNRFAHPDRRVCFFLRSWIMSMEIDQATIKSMALGRVYNYVRISTVWSLSEPSSRSIKSLKASATLLNLQTYSSDQTSLIYTAIFNCID